MIIAVPYVDGSISDHFGRTECFKIYDADEKKIISAQDVKTDGRGHFYMVQFLVGYNTKAVICKGMGEPSRKALEIAGIQVVITDENTADAAVEKFIMG